MPNHRNRFPARRRFLKQTTALTATVVALPLPSLASAETAREKNQGTAQPPRPAQRALTQRKRSDKK
jgi:hypothetical protein